MLVVVVGRRRREGLEGGKGKKGLGHNTGIRDDTTQQLAHGGLQDLLDERFLEGHRTGGSIREDDLLDRKEEAVGVRGPHFAEGLEREDAAPF